MFQSNFESRDDGLKYKAQGTVRHKEKAQEKVNYSLIQ